MIFFISKRICPNACEVAEWIKRDAFPTACDHEKNRLRSGFEQLTVTMKSLVSKSKESPNLIQNLDTVEKIANDFREIEALKENVDNFEEEFSTIVHKIRELKQKVRKRAQDQFGHESESQEAEQNQLLHGKKIEMAAQNFQNLVPTCRQWKCMRM